MCGWPKVHSRPAIRNWAATPAQTRGNRSDYAPKTHVIFRRIRLNFLSVSVVVLGVLGIAMALTGLAIAAFSDAWAYWQVAAVCVVFGLTAVGWNGVQISEKLRLSPPGMAAVVSGGSTFIMFFGVVFYPPLFALIHDAAGSYRAPFVALAIPVLLMDVVQLASCRRST